MRIQLKKIKGEVPAKHNESIEFMVYADGEFEGNVAIYGQFHHSCKEKGFSVKGKVFDRYEDALDYGVKDLLDKNLLAELEEEVAMEVLDA